MRRCKLKILRLLVFSALILFLFVTRSIVQNIEEFTVDLRGPHIFLPGKHPKPLTVPPEKDALDQKNVRAVVENVLANNEGVWPNSLNEDPHKPRVHVKDVPPRESRKSLQHAQKSTARTDGFSEYDIVSFKDDYGNVTYPRFVEESPQDGPGEGGKGYTYTPSSRAEHREDSEGKRRNSFNQFRSDRISVNRRLVDSRHDECKTKVYRKDLAAASVIIAFHNEAWSTLLRSVHSVLNRSPPSLLREIILVDDASTHDHLQAPLEKYMSKLKKIRLVRHRRHEGLVRARLTGYQLAQGPVLVFLDSHIECFPGWLEPMLDRIADNPRAVPFPHIDYISPSTFGTGSSLKDVTYGIFHWRFLNFDWGSINKKVLEGRKSPADPIRSPTMPGGLFAIDKQWFTTLGTYDPDMKYWGGENMEISFKTWMCNGTIELLPCSHVGHVFRSTNPIKWKGSNNAVLANSVRVAEVWMDQYKNIFYEQTHLPEHVEYGDVTERRKLRQSLHCHDFKWYLENIFTEHVLPVSVRHGEIRSVHKPDKCLDNAGKNTVILLPCHGAGGNQIWELRENGRLVHSNWRTVQVVGRNITLVMQSDSQPLNWTYTQEQTLQTLGLCLSVDESSILTMQQCDGSTQQQWIFPKSKFRL